jgi:hypothetical protein
MKTQMTTRSLIAAAILMTAGLGAASIPATASAAPMRPIAVKMDMRASARIDARIRNLREDIRMGERTHRLSPREASRLTTKLNAIARLKRSYDRHGLTRSEIATLNGKLDVLNGHIRVQAHDGNRR